MNLAPAAARAGIDIHFPVDITAAEAEVQLAATLSRVEGVIWRVLRRDEPNSRFRVRRSIGWSRPRRARC